MSASPIRRVGLFGGAFDPPHRTHTALAQAAITQLQLDVLHVVPTGHAWHKQRTLTAATHRLAMCALAFAQLPLAKVDDREIRRSGPTYTVDTLVELQAQYPNAHLYLLMGEDQARSLGTWHRAEELARAATICVASRPDSGAAGAPSTSAIALQGFDFHPVQMPASTVSATEIREKTAQGHSVAPLVFESVARYIEHHHLYQAA